MKLTEIEARLAELEQKLRPIAARSFDFNDPDWITKLASQPNPLDEAGIRLAAEDVLNTIVVEYTTNTESIRRHLRELCAKYRSFSWGVTFIHFPATIDGVRRELALFSLLDQGRDARDAILWLRGIVKRAIGAGVQIKPLLAEAASLSSTIDKYGMGSTRDWLIAQSSH